MITNKPAWFGIGWVIALLVLVGVVVAFIVPIDPKLVLILIGGLAIARLIP